MQPTPPTAGGADPLSGFAGCYRHPDRLTGVRCVRCDRPICPECQIAASVGFQCPDDVRAGAATVRQPRSSLGATLSGNGPVVTYVLIALNVVTYFATSLGQGGSFATSQGTLFDDWVMQPAAVEQNHQFYRLITGAFLHVSPIHILLNMVALYVIGTALEPVMGRWRFLAVYLLAALGGSVAVLLFGPFAVPVAGASGAIYGLFAAALLLSRVHGVFQFRPLLITVIFNFVLTFSLAGISKLGHIGGFTVGALATLALLGWTVPAQARYSWTSWAKTSPGQLVSLAGLFLIMVVATAAQVS